MHARDLQDIIVKKAIPGKLYINLHMSIHWAQGVQQKL